MTQIKISQENKKRFIKDISDQELTLCQRVMDKYFHLSDIQPVEGFQLDPEQVLDYLDPVLIKLLNLLIFLDSCCKTIYTTLDYLAYQLGYRSKNKRRNLLRLLKILQGLGLISKNYRHLKTNEFKISSYFRDPQIRKRLSKFLPSLRLRVLWNKVRKGASNIAKMIFGEEMSHKYIVFNNKVNIQENIKSITKEETKNCRVTYYDRVYKGQEIAKTDKYAGNSMEIVRTKIDPAKYNQSKLEDTLRKEFNIPKLTFEIFQSLPESKQIKIKQMFKDCNVAEYVFFKSHESVSIKKIEPIIEQIDTFLQKRKVGQDKIVNRVIFSLGENPISQSISKLIIDIMELSKQPTIDILKEFKTNNIKNLFNNLLLTLEKSNLSQDKVTEIIDIIYDEIELPDNLKEYKTQSIEAFYIKLLQKGDK